MSSKSISTILGKIMESKMREFIKNIIKEEIELSGDKEKAKQAIIAFSRNLIPKNQINIKFELSTPDYDEGYNETEGVILIKLSFEGEIYEVDFSVIASFYASGGYGGDFLGPIDTARAPEPQEIEDKHISIEDSEIIIYDQEENEYNFLVSEFEPNLIKGIERILTQYYQP